MRAAAEMIVKEGVGVLTHRRVAADAGVSLGATTYYFASLQELKVQALRHLADQIDGWIAETRQELADHDGHPAALCALLREYLVDRDQTRADFALTLTAVDDPELRPLGNRWFDGLTAVLSEYTGPESARAIAVFCDGATVHALLHDEPLDTAFLYRAITALMGSGQKAEGDS